MAEGGIVDIPRKLNCNCCSKRYSGFSNIVVLQCEHEICSGCLLKLAVEAIHTKSAEGLICPVVIGCRVRIATKLFKSFLEPELYKKIENFVDKAKISNGDAVKIPSCPECGEKANVDLDNFYGCCTKSSCSYIFCSQCLSEYHGFECSLEPQLEAFDEDDDDDFYNYQELQEQLQAVIINQEARNKDINFHSLDEHCEEIEPTIPKATCCMCITPVDYYDIIDFGCEHTSSCKDCTKRFFETLIASGDIHKLQCPEPGCGKNAPQTLVKDLVEPELFAKYDDLLLNEALGNFPEIVNCPNLECQRRVVAEPEYGYCEYCDYRFCTECNQPFHGTTQCGMTEEERKHGIIHGIEEEKSERQQQDAASEMLIKNVFKKCPTCNASIEKNEGCNKMQCTKCQSKFCWLCGLQITLVDPYDHFKTSDCQLFEVPPE